ncbi:hypothetical protein Dimus_001422, partial [Dionaea muscipula]
MGEREITDEVCCRRRERLLSRFVVIEIISRWLLPSSVSLGMEISMSLGMKIAGLPDQWVRRRRRVGASAVAGSSTMAGCIVVDGGWLIDDGWVPLCRRWWMRGHRWWLSCVVGSGVNLLLLVLKFLRKNRGWVELGLENGFNAAPGGSSNLMTWIDLRRHFLLIRGLQISVIERVIERV